MFCFKFNIFFAKVEQPVRESPNPYQKPPQYKFEVNNDRMENKLSAQHSPQKLIVPKIVQNKSETNPTHSGKQQNNLKSNVYAPIIEKTKPRIPRQNQNTNKQTIKSDNRTANQKPSAVQVPAKKQSLKSISIQDLLAEKQKPEDESKPVILPKNDPQNSRNSTHATKKPPLPKINKRPIKSIQADSIANLKIKNNDVQIKSTNENFTASDSKSKLESVKPVSKKSVTGPKLLPSAKPKKSIKSISVQELTKNNN